MPIVKYTALFALLFGRHFFLDSTWLAIAWCCLGIALAFPANQPKFLLLKILLLDLLVGCLFWIFFWRSNGSLYWLSRNSNTSSFSWVGISIAINMITLFFCAGTFFYLIRLIKHIQARKA